MKKGPDGQGNNTPARCVHTHSSRMRNGGSLHAFAKCAKDERLPGARIEARLHQHRNSTPEQVAALAAQTDFLLSLHKQTGSRGRIHGVRRRTSSSYWRVWPEASYVALFHCSVPWHVAGRSRMG